MQAPLCERRTVVVHVNNDDAVGILHEKIEAETGVSSKEQQLVFDGRPLPVAQVHVSSCGIGCDATLSLVFRGQGGMSSQSPAEEWRVTGAVDAALRELCLLRRCTHRIHRFSPGLEGLALLHDGDRCTSVGHWSLVACGKIARSSLSSSSLHAASRAGRADVIETLVTHYGLEVNTRDVGGWTALHTAMAHCNAAAVRRLVTLGASDVASDDGVRASMLGPRLWYQVTADCPTGEEDSWGSPGSAHEAVNELVKMTAQEHVSTEFLCHCACLSVEQLGASVLQLLGTEKVCVGGGKRCWTVLAAAASTGRYSLSRFCVELGAWVDATIKGGFTPLCVACFQNQLPCARLLLEHGADANHADENGATPLLWACRFGHTSCARLLMDHDADVDKGNSRGASPLLWASAFGHLECARLLLLRGAATEHSNSLGATPLLSACGANRRHVAALLLENGADPTAQDGAGATPAASARSHSFGAPDSELAKLMDLAIRDRTAAARRLREMDAEGPTRSTRQRR